MRFSVQAGGHRARAVAFNRSCGPRRRAGRRDVRAGGQRVQRRRRAAPAAALRPAGRAGRDHARGGARRPRAGGAARARGAAAGRRRARRGRRPARPPRRRDRRSRSARSWPPASPCWWCAPTRAARAEHLAGRLGGLRAGELGRRSSATRRSSAATRTSWRWTRPPRPRRPRWCPSASRSPGASPSARSRRWPMTPAGTSARRRPPSSGPLRAGGGLADAVDASPSPAVGGRALRGAGRGRAGGARRQRRRRARSRRATRRPRRLAGPACLLGAAGRGPQPVGCSGARSGPRGLVS